ncbi:lantibiotic dehydratase [Streptomyces kronopolitis]|uniref:lantibiotic dehydratase n=1 Tax=Streptomyces kronopolitis TaxID=1612435 RepID=UPI00341A9273
MEWYGAGRAVPLLEVLDPRVDIGQPAGYGDPHGERMSPVSIAGTWLTAPKGRAKSALAWGVGRVVMDDEALERLSRTRQDI